MRAQIDGLITMYSTIVQYFTSQELYMAHTLHRPPSDGSSKLKGNYFRIRAQIYDNAICVLNVAVQLLTDLNEDIN